MSKYSSTRSYSISREQPALPPSQTVTHAAHQVARAEEINQASSRPKLGRPEFGSTAFMFAAGRWIYTIESDGSLYRVSPW